MIDKDIFFFENGDPFSYENILEYCSYIQPKNFFSIYSTQYMARPEVGFNDVQQWYKNSESDTLKATSSRIRQFKSDR